jgi:hypothetical protein
MASLWFSVHGQDFSLYKGCGRIRNCAEISCAKQAQDFLTVARRQIAGILCVFQDLTTKLQAKKTSQIAQGILKQFQNKKDARFERLF